MPVRPYQQLRGPLLCQGPEARGQSQHGLRAGSLLPTPRAHVPWEQDTHPVVCPPAPPAGLLLSATEAPAEKVGHDSQQGGEKSGRETGCGQKTAGISEKKKKTQHRTIALGNQLQGFVRNQQGTRESAGNRTQSSKPQNK